MKIYKILSGTAAVAVCLLLLILLRFASVNQVAEEGVPEDKTLRVLAPYETSMQQQILKSIGGEYSREEGHPEIEFEFVSKENLKKELSLRGLNGQEKIDVVICDSELMRELITLHILREIHVTNELKNRVRVQQLWNSTRSSGRYYGVPLTCDPYVLFYHKNRLEEEGIPVPDDWKEMIRSGLQLKKAGRYTIGIAGREDEDLTNVYRLMLYGQGETMHGIGGAAGTKSFEYFYQMSRYGLLSREMLNMNQTDLARVFAEGKMDLMINQLSAVNTLRSSRIDFTVGIARLPADESDMVYVNGENIGLTVDAQSESQEFLEYLVQADVSERISDAMDTIPAYADAFYQTDKKIYMDHAEELLDGARMPDAYRSWSRISRVVGDGVQAVMATDAADPEVIAQDVYEEVRDAILKG